ncbi:DGQHR domain-containing protein [Planosporangium thailandense]|uniref:DGQHR domain-containing protein n=1 Tax=Planosporangium thailandense TaxID=765197 RepID=A0ABX0XY67_9ACTN|nr:DGQHR domain-containing protein [Planosporangium thailandense]
MADRYELVLPALEVRQGERRIYSFAVDGKKLSDFTAVSRVRRDQQHALKGYQRPEVTSHIRAIRRYLESPGAMLPNALVVAFDDRVRFEPASGSAAVSYAQLGELIVPVDESWDDAEKPAWLVDGQQRTAAVRDAAIDEFPLCVVGFLADSDAEQRSQFILVNSTKPLPAGLIHELLPATQGELPVRYLRRRLPAEVLARLNLDEDSPFWGLIATPTSPNGVIKDNSILKMLENSLSDGALYQYRDPATGTGDVDAMAKHVKTFWTLVKACFPDAWGLLPRQSRLMHGVGIQAMGYVMDALTDGVKAGRLPVKKIEKILAELWPEAAWTSGTWTFDDGTERRWNSLQNTPNDIRLLTDHLLRRVRLLS